MGVGVEPGLLTGKLAISEFLVDVFTDRFQGK